MLTARIGDVLPTVIIRLNGLFTVHIKFLVFYLNIYIHKFKYLIIYVPSISCCDLILLNHNLATIALAFFVYATSLRKVQVARSHRDYFSSLFLSGINSNCQLASLCFTTLAIGYMDDNTSTRALRNRTVGRNTSSNYRDFLRIRATPYAAITSSPPTARRRSLSPPKRRTSPPHSDRFIPYSFSSPISLRHILSSPAPQSPLRDGSQTPTNPQLHSPGKCPEWPNSYTDKIHSHRLASALELPISPKLLHFHSQPPSPIHSPPPAAHDEGALPASLDPPSLVRQQQRTRFVPPDPFRILDAPELQDDYYAQPLSWSTRGSIAVALGLEVFLWNPPQGVTQLPLVSVEDITSLAFNSTLRRISPRSSGVQGINSPRSAC